MPNGAVLAAGIHGLEDDQQGLLVLRVEQVLQLMEFLEILLGDFCRAFSARNVGGVVGSQSDSFTFLPVSRKIGSPGP